MHPILFEFGPLTIYSYGVMVALGFALATACVYHRAPQFNIDKNKMVDIMILVLVSGIAGARVFYILQNIGYYRANPYEIINLSKGGLVWYGGFLAGLGGLIVYVKMNRMSFWAVVDLIVPYVALAQAFGRLGCFLNGCCYGTEVPASFIFAVPMAQDGALHHPTQIYSALLLALIFIVLRIWQEHRRFVGEIFLGYCMLYSLKRFFVEFLRGDNPRIYFGLTISQVISCAVCIVSVVIFTILVSRWKKR